MRPYYRFCRFIVQWAAVLYFKARVFGIHNVPAKGGALVVSNHQSFMDPIFAAMAIPREGSFMARDTLFTNRFFGRLITSVNAFPVKRNAADIGAIKECLRRLKQGMVVVIFPEGTRSADGRISPMLPGLAAIAKKASVPVIPTLIDGVYQVWPRSSPLPRPGDVIIEYDRAILPDEFADMSAEQLMERVHDRLVTMQARWHSRMPHRRLKWSQPETP